ncbi:E3 ubiquitin-protein ligase BRE1A, partial [Ophiophagus hannah]
MVVSKVLVFRRKNQKVQLSLEKKRLWEKGSCLQKDLDLGRSLPIIRGRGGSAAKMLSLSIKKAPCNGVSSRSLSPLLPTQQFESTTDLQVKEPLPITNHVKLNSSWWAHSCLPPFKNLLSPSPNTGSEKDLGGVVDSKLNMGQQCGNYWSKALLRCIRRLISKTHEVIVCLYSCLVRSYLGARCPCILFPAGERRQLGKAASNEVIEDDRWSWGNMPCEQRLEAMLLRRSWTIASRGWCHWFFFNVVLSSVVLFVLRSSSTWPPLSSPWMELKNHHFPSLSFLENLKFETGVLRTVFNPNGVPEIQMFSGEKNCMRLIKPSFGNVFCASRCPRSLSDIGRLLSRPPFHPTRHTQFLQPFFFVGFSLQLPNHLRWSSLHSFRSQWLLLCGMIFADSVRSAGFQQCVLQWSLWSKSGRGKKERRKRKREKERKRKRKREKREEEGREGRKEKRKEGRKESKSGFLVDFACQKLAKGDHEPVVMRMKSDHLAMGRPQQS